MRKISKIFCTILSFILLCSLFGACSSEEKKTVDTTNAPDYSNSEKQFNFWAYGDTCDDWYQTNGVRYFFEEGTMQTPEHTQLYVDAGFKMLFIDYTFQEDSLVSGYNFESGKLKKVMDLAQEKGLKCFISQPNIRVLSNCEESRINQTKALNVTENTGSADMFFNSQEELNAYVAKILTGLKDHPAFAGVSLTDEPNYKKFDAISEVYKAILSVKPDAYVMMNLLPLADSEQHKLLYCGKINLTLEESYIEYLNTYYEKMGKDCGFIQYDDYPILNGGILETFLRGNQIVSNFAKEKGLVRRTVYQTCNYSNRRPVTTSDLLFQLNIGMAMGNQDFSYYTYYPVVNWEYEVEEENYIVDRHGNPNPIYYTLKDFHKVMQVNAKALMNFKYKGLQIKSVNPMPSGMGYISGLQNDEFSLLKDFTVQMKVQNGGLVLVTELYDATNERFGYYVVNATDPAFTSEADVELDFGDYSYAQVYQFGQVVNTCTNGGKLKISIGTGGGAFVMPF